MRLVFCLFAEDAEAFPKDAFYRYLNGLPARQVRVALKELFKYLDTPPESRDPYVSDGLKRFPYVNGGLFAADVEIPQFSEEILQVLVNEVSEGTNWSQISPTIFGGVFESTLNPQTRRSGGMHYTSPENIHKVIGPLFLDDLKQELTDILEDTSLGERARRNRLERYHDKIASLTFFEYADGSRTSLSIRHLSAALILFGASHTFRRYPLRTLFAIRSKHPKPARTPASTPAPDHTRGATNPSNSLFY